jgi:hypothetical protein
MSESNNQDPLEEFFQKKSGDYDISYREEDWKALEGRLDALDAQFASRRRRRLAAAAVLAIVSLLSYFIYQNYQEINSLNEQLSRQEQQEPATSTTPDSLPEKGVPANERPIPDIADIQDLTQDNPVTGQSGRNGISETVSQEDEGIATVSESGQNRARSQAAARSLAITSLDCKDCELTEDVSFETPIRAVQPADNKFSADTAPFAALTGEQESPSAANPIISGSVLSNISVGFVLGPDMSTAGNLSNFYDPGSKIGITVDYKINSNWAVSVGAIRSKVNYKAGSQDYNAPAGYWYNGIEASQTRAQCVLIDVPINLLYRFLKGEQSRFYASAGLSSYIMLNEDYRFSYDSEQPEFPQRWNEDTGTAHLLSNANISVGYEYDLTKSVSLRAEPFFRVPLREVGWGNVNLYSMGSLVSINYNLKAY